MRIRDLLAAESIQLNGAAAGKTEVLNQMVDLMAKSGKISDVETYRAGVQGRKKEQPELVKESRFHIVSPMRSISRDLQQWLYRMVLSLIP